MIGRGHRGRTDANHKAIVAALRKLGATVQSLGQVGSGCPDLLVGWCNRTVLMELKDGTKPPSAQRLSEAEMAWHIAWDGAALVIVHSADEAVNVMLALTGGGGR